MLAIHSQVSRGSSRTSYLSATFAGEDIVCLLFHSRTLQIIFHDTGHCGQCAEKRVKLELVTWGGAIEMWCLERIGHSDTELLQPKVASNTTQLERRRHGRCRIGGQRSRIRDRGGRKSSRNRSGKKVVEAVGMCSIERGSNIC